MFGCGTESSKNENKSSISDEITTIQEVPYKGILEVMDGSNPCFGGSFYYIQHNNIRYQVSDYSSQQFLDAIKNIFDGVSKYKPFEAGGCHNKYNLQFHGKFTKEMKWVGAGEVMTDVIQVESFVIQ